MKPIIVIAISILTITNSYSQNIKSDSTQVHFDGFYFGLNGGSQNVFGGSFVNGIDILAQESKFVAELSLGYRKQFLKNRLVLGLQYQMGFLNGNLSYYNPVEPLSINYKNSFQSGFGGLFGFTLGPGKNWLIMGYVNETKRKFNVRIQQGTSKFSQTDEQGMLKYGIGIERQLYRKINVRAQFGGLNVDFGELITNIDVEDKYDLTLGIVLQL
ncbi:MAG: hypothetical protein RH948_02685 [Cyclobacteriaceae bacterium]